MQVVGRRGWQQALLLLSLIVGVVTMHSTIACHADSGSAPASHATAHSGRTYSAPPSSSSPAVTSPHVSDGMSVPALESMGSRVASAASGDGHVTLPDPAAQQGPMGTGALAVPLNFSAAGLVVPATDVVLPALAALSGLDGSSPGDSMPGLHELLHLCLAVLTALIAFSAVVLLAFLAAQSGVVFALRRAERPASGPRAPPPTGVRLAQLCVLRN